MKKTLTIITSLTMLFAIFTPISCFANQYHMVKAVQLISDYKDFDCEEEVDLHNKTNGSFEEHYPKNIDYNFYKAKKCIMQNFNKALQTANEEFNQFTNNYLLGYQSFEQINEKIKIASKGIMDLNKLLVHIKNVANFKATVVFVYNVLAKLLGSKITPYLIFNLIIIKDYDVSNTLAISVGFADKMAIMDHMCIKYTVSALNIDYEKLTENYENGFWATDSINHPFIHEFGHIIDYFMRMPIEKRQALLTADPLTFNSCDSNNESVNASIENEHSDRVQFFNVSVGTQKLKDYLYYNIKNHHLINNAASRKLLAYIVVASRYSNEIYGEGELFAEAFSQWLLTKQEKRGKNWQILHRFFTEYIKTNYYLC